MSPTNDAAPTPPLSAPRRRRAMLALGALVLAAALAWGLYWQLVLRHAESTDNAYVQAPLVQITPLIAGTVSEVLVDDTDRVEAGQPLVRLNPADARLAFERSRAALAQAVRELRALRAQDGSLDAQSKLRSAELQRARADLARAEDDAARRRKLVAAGAVSDEEMRHAEATLAAARSAVIAAESAQAAAAQQALGNLALSQGTKIADHPSVLRAAAAMREAWLDLQRTELRSPLAGQVARRTVQLGQHVAAGAVLMTVIPLDQAWVEANFKEGQLRRMHIGQAVTLHADAYGGDVEYRGHVAGIGAGTGAAFALLPAQNATGNWIKVVQRVPVRIELDNGPLAEHPLRVGLSMTATVHLDDVKGGAGAATAAPGAAGGAAALDEAMAAQLRAADAQVREVIKANLGPAARQ
jgi:membrane fusion protein (multidrug efflux system)